MSISSRNVLISYRRRDAPGHAGRIFDHLVTAFGAENLFAGQSPHLCPIAQLRAHDGRMLEFVIDAR
jgi:hypothetical protein